MMGMVKAPPKKKAAVSAAAPLGAPGPVESYLRIVAVVEDPGEDRGR